ncbi:hypothetical protein BD413DRAFT_616946 [Trametes elegans]|nr:hypothetical protein BD413DRAFT_616946 [Trametes elegans]
MRDALEGHRLAWEYGGVLHKHVSSGNILIVDRARPGRKLCRGIINDFDYSAMLVDPPNIAYTVEGTPSAPDLAFYAPENAKGYPNAAGLKERTGTYSFMAMELLDVEFSQGVLHQPYHDLESFIWVLLWIVLRHTTTQHNRGVEEYSRIFQHQNDYAAYDAKRSWVTHPKRNVVVSGNPPLTSLLSELKGLLENSHRREEARVLLTHKALLNAFDTAIARDDWPLDNRALPFVPLKTDIPTTGTGALLPSPGKNKKRTRRDADDDEEAIFEDDGSLESGVSESAMAKRRRNSRAQTASRASKAAGPSTRGSGRRGGRSQPKKAASGEGPASGGTRGSGKKKGV